jgi:hypothetical protein
VSFSTFVGIMEYVRDVVYYAYMINYFRGLNKTNHNEPAVAAVAPLMTETVSNPQPSVVALSTPDVAVAGSETSETNQSTLAQVASAIAHDRQCSLTIGEAQRLFSQNLRRPLSERSLQRYCASGAIVAQLVSHSQGKEYLLNEPSLLAFIKSRPVQLADAPTPVDAPRVTELHDVREVLHKPVIIATPLATAQPALPDSFENAEIQPPTHEIKSQGTDVAPEASAASADNDDYADPAHIGDSRRLGDILIENARLTALLEGKDDVIGVLKSHDAHLREQLTQSTTLTTRLTGDVVTIATKMLSTMQAIGTAGRGGVLPEPSEPTSRTPRDATGASY